MSFPVRALPGKMFVMASSEQSQSSFRIRSLKSDQEQAWLARVRSEIVGLVREHVVSGFTKIKISQSPFEGHKMSGFEKSWLRLRKRPESERKKVAIRIPKLTDCKVHLQDVKDQRQFDTMVFSLRATPLVAQWSGQRCLYPGNLYLKGKPLNCYGLKRDAIYKDEELYNIMRALGVEDGMDGLRYNKVVIATDATSMGCTFAICCSPISYATSRSWSRTDMSTSGARSFG